MRDMARVVTVKSFDKMFEKDRIVCAQFEETAYEAIIPKDEAVPGKKLIFIEADSILPDVNAWEFLRKRCWREDLNGFLIKPMTMGAKENPDGTKGEKVKSWGLVVAPEDCGLGFEDYTKMLKAGEDVTEKLGIRKYEPVEDASPKAETFPKFIKFLLSHKLTRWIGKLWIEANKSVSNAFPTWLISKSDETTLQNMPGILVKGADSPVVITAKMEGQSATATLDVKKSGKVGKIYVCSRNQAYKKPNNKDFWKFVKAHNLEDAFKKYYKATGLVPIVQAEQCGPGIQSNIYNFDELQWFVYRLRFLNPKTKVISEASYDELSDICLNDLGLEPVPMICEGVLKDILPDMDKAIKFAEEASFTWYPGTGFYSFMAPEVKQLKGKTLWKDYFMHEGIVVKSVPYDKEANIGFSFKVKNLPYAEHGLGKIHDEVKAKREANL